jgi:hypothetical protein
MRCKDCKKRSNETGKRPRLSRRAKVARCERCGGLILALPDMTLGADDGTLAQLTRFGLAFTGDPLLELKREGR